MEVMDVDHQELEVHIEKNYNTKLPLYVWGTTGIGKSESVFQKSKQLAEKFKREFVNWNSTSKEMKHNIAEHPEKYFVLMDIRLSQMDPSDLRGLPALNGKDIVEWKVPFWLYVCTLKNITGFLFFDEINLAPPSIQASAYQIILDRALGEVTIADGMGVIAAGNRISDRANVYDLPKPLQNRFNHIALRVPNIEDWTKWAIQKGVDTRIITFLNARPTLLMGKLDAKSADMAFPTPRSWGKYCSALIKDVDDLRLLKSFTCTSVGTGAAMEFESFIKLQRQINLSEVLKNPESVKKITETDMKYSLIGLIAEWYDKHSAKEDLDKILKIANHFQPEFAILMLRFAKEKHTNSFRKDAPKLESWKAVWDKYGKYFEI